MKSMKKCIWMMFAMATIALLTGCGSSRAKISFGQNYYTPESEQKESQFENQTEDLRPYYLITSLDSVQETMTVYNYEKKETYLYRYGMDTKFLDKYGDRASVVNFTPGKAIEIGALNTKGKVSKIQLSDQVWEYEDVVRFSIDSEHEMITVANEKYRYDDNLRVFSGNEEVSLEKVTKEDTIKLVGSGKKILAIEITTGHGSLVLSNTELFEGSFLQIGTKMFVEITKDMKMELAEGTYAVTVANDGWGGTTEIAIERGKTTSLDLDSIKGEGPKYGKVLFLLDDVETRLYIDGQEVDYMDPIELRYGKHKLEIRTKDNVISSKYLYVNSAEATISIEVEAEKRAASNSSSAGANGSQSTDNKKEDGNTTNSDTNRNPTTNHTNRTERVPSAQQPSTNSNGTSSAQGLEKDVNTLTDGLLTDYLSTLTEKLKDLK